MATNKEVIEAVAGLSSMVEDIRAELLGFRDENRQLRQELGTLRARLASATGREVMPQAERSVSTPGPAPYSRDPMHDPQVTAAIMEGRDHKPALREAVRRLAAQGPRDTGPGKFNPDFDGTGHVGIDVTDSRAAAMRKAERSHAQRRANAGAQRTPDLAGAPIMPGGTMSRNETTGQITIKPPAAGRTCPAGHPAEVAGDKFCRHCGGPIAAPAIGEDWESQDPTLHDMVNERRIDEGIVDADEVTWALPRVN